MHHMSAPLTIGPYSVMGRLGKGAMGVVYRGQRDGTGDVALKTVIVDSDEQVAALRREIAALARLGHPGVANIVDHGIERGLPWYAMQLIEGVPLSELAQFAGMISSSNPSIAQTWSADVEPEAADGGRTPLLAMERRPRAAGGRLPHALGIVAALCEPLAWLHGEGIVHRDLKPSNIMIVEQKRPVLVDFGLVGRFGRREKLTVARQRAGTVSYMSPEQIRGDPVDARADLYGLGCILYQLICGRPPFVSRSASAILHQHIEVAPKRPSERVTGVSEELDKLVLSLLEKEPENRLGYADLVAARLVALGATPPERVGRKPRPYLYAGRFAGRKADLKRVELLLHGGVAFIGAESGGGKTRLALELARRVGRTHHVELAECVPVATEGVDQGGAPLYPMAGVLQHIADACRKGEEARLIGTDARAILPLLPGSESDPIDPRMGTHGLLRALSLAVARLSPERPTLLLLDDLQWADALTMEWLEMVARTRPEGLKILCTYRVEEVDESLGSLLAAYPESVHLLPTLGERAIGEMVRDMLALKQAPTQFVQFVTQQTQGNPFFVGEFLRTAIAEQLLLRDERGQWHVLSVAHKEAAGQEQFEAMALPGSLRAMVGRRLAGLSERARDVAGQLATLGREVRVELLAAATGQIDEAVAELERRLVVTRAPGMVRFHHDKLRESAYEAIDLARRPEFHQRAARALETHGHLEGNAAALGFHSERARLPFAARAWYLQAARSAESRHAAKDAARFLAAALQQDVRMDASTVRARVNLAHLQRLIGEGERAMEQVEQAITGAEALGDNGLQAHALRVRAALHIALGSLEDALVDYRVALVFAEDLGDAKEQARCWLGIADACRTLGRTSEAFEALDLAHSLAPGDSDLEDRRLSGLARLTLEEGSHVHALALYREQLALARESESPFRIANALNGVGNALARPGRLDEALATYQEALEVNRASGNRSGEGVILANMAIQLHRLGRNQEADDRHAVGVEILREIGSRRYCGHALSFMAKYARMLGRPEVVRERATEAAEILRDVGDRVWLPTSLGELARLALSDGDPGTAEALAREGMEGRTDASPAGDLELLLGDALIGQKRNEEAIDWLDEVVAMGGKSGQRALSRLIRALVLGNYLEDAKRTLGTLPPDLDPIQDGEELSLWWLAKAEYETAIDGNGDSARQEAAAARARWIHTPR